MVQVFLIDWLFIRNSARLFHHVLFNMEDLHLVLSALNLSTLNAGILIIMFSLNMVDYSMSFLSLSAWGLFWTFLTLWVFMWDPSFMLKSYRVVGWGGGGGGLWDFSVSPRPLGFGFWGFGAKGLGPGLDNNTFSNRATCRLFSPYISDQIIIRNKRIPYHKNQS